MLRVVDDDAAVRRPTALAPGGGCRDRRDLGRRHRGVLIGNGRIRRQAERGVGPDIRVEDIDARHHAALWRGQVAAQTGNGRACLGHGLSGRGQIGGDAVGKRRPARCSAIGGREEAVAAVRIGLGCGRGRMAAVALEHLARPHLQPVTVLGEARQPPPVRIQDVDLERDVGRNLDEHRAVGLDGGVAHDLAHVVGRPERFLREIDDGPIRDRDRLDQADEAGRPLTGRRGAAGKRDDAAGRGIDSVEVIDALDVDLADALRPAARDPA